MKPRRNRAMAAVAAASLIAGIGIGQMAPANAQLGQILKGGAVALVVSQFGDQIDRFINTLTGNKTDNGLESTRVVPILSIGKGTYAGAVQVTGPRDLVDQVKAVAQIEGEVRIVGSRVRAKGLIPVSTTRVNDLGSLSRVKGVGVSALIDVKL